MADNIELENHGKGTHMKLAMATMFLLLAAGCVSPLQSTRMHVAANASQGALDSANALVVFVMPKDRVLANAILDTEGHEYGELPPRTKLVVSVPPGPRTFLRGLYKNPGKGNFALWGEAMCHGVSGTFEAGKVYFVELGVFGVSVVKPGDARLTEWARLPTVQPDNSITQANATTDPDWQKCLARSTREAELLRTKHDSRSLVGMNDGMTAWPNMP